MDRLWLWSWTWSDFSRCRDLTRPNHDALYILGSDFRPSLVTGQMCWCLSPWQPFGKVIWSLSPRSLGDDPGYFEERINASCRWVGSNCCHTLQTNFGIYPTDYVWSTWRFSGDNRCDWRVTFETEFQTADACDSSLDPDRGVNWPRKVTLDKDWALWYVAPLQFQRLWSFAKNAGSVRAVAKKASAQRGGWMAGINGCLCFKVESNLSPDDFYPLSVRFWLCSRWRYPTLLIGPNEAVGTRPQTGAGLNPNVPMIQSILQEALFLNKTGHHNQTDRNGKQLEFPRAGVNLFTLVFRGHLKTILRITERSLQNMQSITIEDWCLILLGWRN